MQGILSGYIIRSDNLEPLAGSLIQIRSKPFVFSSNQNDNHISETYKSQLTDKTGSFLFTFLQQGHWIISYRGNNGEFGEKVVYVFDKSVSEVQIEIDSLNTVENMYPLIKKCISHQSAKIEGRVVDATTNRPIEDATVIIVSGSAPVRDIAPLTDVDGKFTLDGLATGEWVLKAISSSGKSGQSVINILDGDTVKIEIPID